MKKLLIHLLKDWGRAPISGTAIIAAEIAAGVALWQGDPDRALLAMILAQLWIMQRGPYFEY